MENQSNNLEPQVPLRASGVAPSMLVVGPAPVERPQSAEDASRLKGVAENEARSWRPTAEKANPRALKSKWSEASEIINAALDQSRELTAKDDSVRADRGELRAHARLLEAAIADTRGLPAEARRLPEIVLGNSQVIPRTYAAVAAYLRAVDWKFHQESFVTFISSVQDSHPLRIRELWVLKPLMQLVLLEEIGRLLSAQGSPDGDQGAGTSRRLESSRSSSPAEGQPETMQAPGGISVLDKDGPGVVDRYGPPAPSASPAR